MAREVRWSDEARSDLHEIAEFISRDSAYLAALSLSRIIERAEQAREFPRGGRVVPEFGSGRIRELLWKDYRIIYRLEENGMLVLTVVRGQRLLNP